MPPANRVPRWRQAYRPARVSRRLATRSRAASVRQMISTVFSPAMVPRMSGFSSASIASAIGWAPAVKVFTRISSRVNLELLEELGKQPAEDGAPFLPGGVLASGVPYAARGGDARDAQVAHVAGQRGLRDIPAAFDQELAEFLLASDGARGDELENGVLTFAFRSGHGVPQVAARG